MTPMASPIAPPVMPLIEVLDALVDVVWRRESLAVVVAAAMLQVKMGVIAIEQSLVEAAVQPAAPFSVQRR